MEFIKRRKHRLSNFCKTIPTPLFESYQNSNAISLSNSLIDAEKQLSLTLTDNSLKKKASFMLKQIVSENSKFTHKQNVVSKKISLMSQPKKKFFKHDYVSQIRIKNRYSHINVPYLVGRQKQRENFNNKSEQGSPKNSTIKQVKNLDRDKPLIPKQFLSLPGYFSLILCKISGEGKNQLIKILCSQLEKWYEKHPDDIPRDIFEVRKISKILLTALDNKQNMIELKPYQVMDVNGTVPRLIFHLVHVISCRKYNKKANLLKIYHQIEYCSRSLHFHQITLKICFVIGNFLKEQHREQQAKVYFDKALKMAIHLNDRFHQQKAIDLIGMSSYVEAKTSSAAFYHANYDKFSVYDRNMVKENYSTKQEIEKLAKVRDFERCQSTSKKQSSNRQQIFEGYTFNGRMQQGNYSFSNKNDFKSNISSYIRIPKMRKTTLKARQCLQKIEKIGSVNRLKKFSTIRGNLISKTKDDIQASNQVLLTHRSLNRLKPDLEIRQIQNERKLLIQLLSYYTSDHLFNFQEMNPYHELMADSHKTIASDGQQK